MNYDPRNPEHRNTDRRDADRRDPRYGAQYGENPNGENGAAPRPRRGGRNPIRRTRHRSWHPNIAVLLLVLIFAVIVLICAVTLSGRRHGNTDVSIPENISDVTAAAPVGGTAQSYTKLDGFTKKTVQNEEIHRGDLILVNYLYPYTFPEDNDITAVYGNKTKSYKVSNTETQMALHVTKEFNRVMDDFFSRTSCGDIMVVSGFRSFESQQRIYRDRVETEGAEEAAKYVATPGYSEHHTGLAMDLTVYLSDGTSHYLADYPACDWFEENADDYGFVLRYPDAKAEITKISYESWHYRYVGVPHAQIMNDKELCLEEYTDYLKGFAYGRKYLVYGQNGTVEESETFPAGGTFSAGIYYVEASAGDTTDVPVPENSEYEISGNNIDGFIVTVKE